MIKIAHIQWLLFLLSPVSAQFTVNNDRNCTANETWLDPHSPISYHTLNASGSFEFPGFRDPKGNQPESDWTWSKGIHNIWNSTYNQTFRYDEVVWLDTHGVDLASKDLDFQVCYSALIGYPQSVQKRGQGDNGDCTTFFNKECAVDLKSFLDQRAAEAIGKNVTVSPCSMLSDYNIDSCDDFQNTMRLSGSIPNKGRNCSFGQGDPDYDQVLLTSETARDAAAKNDLEDFDVYDRVVTSILPVFALAWSKNSTGGGWSDSRIMCLSTPNVTEGSRKASVPSASGRVELNVLVLISGLVVLIISY